MTLSAQDVHDKQFKLVRNSTGYDMDEVDAFLDEVEAAVKELSDRLAAVEERAADAEPAAPAQDVGSAAASILAMAQQTADDYVAQARRTAASMVADAESSARESVQMLEEQRRHLEERVAALRTFESEVRTRLTGFFESQLADLKSLTGD
jgi:DivIVA domain-containing protein